MSFRSICRPAPSFNKGRVLSHNRHGPGYTGIQLPGPGSRPFNLRTEHERWSKPQTESRPSIYNPVIPLVVLEAGDLIEQISVIPERFWFDEGVSVAPADRFHSIEESMEMLRYCADGRTVSGHGIGLSLPSAMPLDEGLLDQIASFAKDFNLTWYSEHMSVFITPHGRVPNAQRASGCPWYMTRKPSAF